VKYPVLSSKKRSVPHHNEELPEPNLPEYLTISDKNSDSDEDHGQQEGGNVERDLKYKQVVPHLTTIY
jgi:hypothetical protein